MDVPANRRSQVVHRHHVAGSRDGHYRRSELPTDRERVVPAGGLLGEQRGGRGVERVALEVYVLQPYFLCQGTRLGYLRLGR
jgi:hypothetical protein